MPLITAQGIVHALLFLLLIETNNYLSKLSLKLIRNYDNCLHLANVMFTNRLGKYFQKLRNLSENSRNKSYETTNILY